MANIIDRAEIKLSPTQLKIIERGWDFKATDSSIVEKIIYTSDGYKVTGYIAYPKNFFNKKFPIIIWNRGGYKDRGFIDEFNAMGILGQIASWGYVVIASMYRGYPADEGVDEFGGDEVNDILNLFSIAAQFPFANTTSFGIEGWSRGGMMTYIILKKNIIGIIPKCVVLISAISNLSESLTFSPSIKKFINAGNYKITEEELKLRSANFWIEDLPIESNYLLIHGGADNVVHANQTLETAKLFFERKFNYRLMILEQGDHFLKKFRKEVDVARKNWFDKWLN
jgi:dipeptidyl aminopeptidase/acylaminoacyl peptidase